MRFWGLCVIFLVVLNSAFGQEYSTVKGLTIPKESAFAIQSKFEDFECILDLGNKILRLQTNKHNSTSEWFTSSIIYCDTPTLAKITYSNKPLRWAIVSVPQISFTYPNEPDRRADCDEPASIDQNIWRSGLPDPTPGRNKTPTTHCIIHHSAAHNGDTNYTQIVRSIYTFHTQSNGWDDIGYNYLIAANGTIYKGRDPEKVGIEQDNVQGAHFCGKNTGTMGVCLIGDLQTQEPADSQLNALIALLKWKVKKSDLAPLKVMGHPSSGDPKLAVIAGHRDGCNTTCPGDKLYAKLDSVRNEANKCSIYLGLANAREEHNLRMERKDESLMVWFNKPVLWKVFTTQGSIIKQGKGNATRIENKGMFVLMYQVNGQIMTRLVVN